MITVETKNGSWVRKCVIILTWTRKSSVREEESSRIPWQGSRNELFKVNVQLRKGFLWLKWRWTQGMQRTGGGGPGRVQNLSVCEYFIAGEAHAGEKGDLTFCRFTVSSAWQKSPGRRNEEDRAARKGKWSPRGTGTTVLTYPCPTASRYRWQ